MRIGRVLRGLLQSHEMSTDLRLLARLEVVPVGLGRFGAGKMDRAFIFRSRSLYASSTTRTPEYWIDPSIRYASNNASPL